MVPRNVAPFAMIFILNLVKKRSLLEIAFLLVVAIDWPAIGGALAIKCDGIGSLLNVDNASQVVDTQ